MQGLRLHLEGVALRDAKGRVTATFRYRTRDGILVNLPESADTLVPWPHIEHCAADLVSGELLILLKPEAVEQHRWLHGSPELRGTWIDRVELDRGP
jgi:hypothetical protein